MNNSFKPQNMKKGEAQKNNHRNLFDLMKGHYFGEDLTYQDFQRSGLLYLEKGIDSKITFN